MSLQGWPVHDAKYADLVDGKVSPRFTDKLLANMAGNAFPGPCIVALLSSVLLATDGRAQAAPTAHTSRDDAKAALEILHFG